MQVSNYAEKAGSRFRRGQSWKINLFGANSNVSSPELQAFRLDFNANQTLDAHFHIVDQFQVFVEGDGTIGRDSVGPIVVHYADHHTGYGPLVASPYGMTYFTLRSKTDAGLNFLREPHVREKLQPTKRRHRMSRKIILSNEPVLADRTEVVIEDALDAQDDDEGIAVKMVRMGPNMQAPAPDTGESGGEYLLVLNGSIIHDGHALDKYSLLFVRADEAPPVLTAGPGGAEVLVTRYPAESEWMKSI
ncbi:hypothetical protein ASD80_06895 [Devosia sp. Root635]|nr:hypothetical protein ASD80_06895 [Devosia sp. Root635]